METSGHKVDQPGLRGHSHDPENDLMKKFVVRVGLTNMDGWMWVASFDNQDAAEAYANLKYWETDSEVQIWDQFNNEIIWSN